MAGLWPVHICWVWNETAVVMQAMGQLQRHIAHRIVLQPLGENAQPSTDSRLSKCHRCGAALHSALLGFVSLMQACFTDTLGAGC